VDAYDLANLDVTVTDANNWQLTGDLLLAPGYSGHVAGQPFADIGDFNLTVVSPVPEPETYAMLLIGLGLVGLTAHRRKLVQLHIV